MSIKGELKDIPLTNLIQMNCQSGITGQLIIQQGQQQANIYFSEGNIIHALLDNHSGKEAFYKLLGWEQGYFQLNPGLLPSEQTIMTHWSDLLLGGLHRLDETTAEKQDTGSKNDNIQSISPDDIGDLFGFEKSTTTVKEADMAQNMREILVELAQEVPGFMSTSVVGMDGLGIVQHAAGSADMEVINAQMTLLFKLVNTSTDKLKAGNLQDFLLTTDKAHLLVRYLSNRNYFLSLAADRRKANLGNLRLYSRIFSDRLEKAMPR